MKLFEPRLQHEQIPKLKRSFLLALRLADGVGKRGRFDPPIFLQVSAGPQVGQRSARLCDKPSFQRYAEALFVAVGRFRSDVAAHNLAQDRFEMASMETEFGRELDGELPDLLIEKWSAGLKAVVRCS